MFPKPQYILLSALVCTFSAGLLPVAEADESDTEPPSAGTCPGTNLGAVVPPAPDRSGIPLTVYAQELDAAKVAAGEARGNVEMYRADQYMSTERVLFNPQVESVTFPEDVSYRDQQFWLNAEEGHYLLSKDSGSFSMIDYGITGTSARGNAEQVELISGSQSRLTQINYTTCPDEKPDWEIRAESMEFLHEEGMGKARNAKLRFKNITVLWVPWFSFPIDDRRKSGFLYPSLGQNSDSGFEIGIPWYWNIAPNQDLTLEPRYFSNRGFALGGEYRLMTPRTGASLNFDYLPSDKITRENRYHYVARHVARPWQHWNSELVLERVSDPLFFQDFGTSLISTSRQFLRSSATLTGAGRYWDLELMADDYQVIDLAIKPQNEPYRRVPRLGFWMDQPLPIDGAYFAMDSELVYFERDIGTTGARVDVYPRVYWDGNYRWGFIRPSAGFRYTGYDLDRKGMPGNETPDRGTGIASLDTGLIFERTSKTGGMQTLEPRLFYLYVPFQDQDDLPLFDSGLYTFGFSQLFNDNRFSGGDRQGDANQLSLAVTTNYYDNNGQQLWGLTLGQILYFDSLRVQLDESDPVDVDQSPFLAELRWKLLSRVDAIAGMQWDWDENRTNLANVGLRYRGDYGQQVNFEYRFRRDRVDQFDFRAYWPINEQWRVLTRVNYSFADDDLLEIQGGFEYESCCWAFKTVIRRYLKNRSGDYRDAIYVELNLKGLASIGTSGRELFPN